MQALVEQARRGSIRAASRLMSRLEDDPPLLVSLFHGTDDWPAPRLVVGITGPPGVGKSRLVDGLIGVWRTRHPDRRVGVIAVDPSSPFSGGAILGDRVRMMRHATDAKVFIRSLGSRGHLGGLTLGTRGAVRVMGLTGCDVVLLETVGVGQGEVEVGGVADVVCVVLAPGAGDSVQMLKAGLIETADVFVVNKADRPGADRLCAQLKVVLSLSPGPPQDRPAIFPVSAARREGLDELADGIEQTAARRSGANGSRPLDSVRRDVREAIRVSARRLVEAELATAPDDAAVDRVLSGRATAAGVARELLYRAAASATDDGFCATVPPEELP